MKTNIKMRVTPEQSKKVQEICFDKGILLGARKIIRHLNIPFLFIDNNITATDNKSFYQRDKSEEIDADLFIRTNGTCEEPIGSKFQPSDKVIRSVAKVNGWDKLETSHYTMNMLLDKLKKKNEILKKARIKRKNQREELHKLNLKLQKCISLEEHRKVINWHIERNQSLFAEIDNLKAENIEMGKLVNLNRSALGLMGATKDLSICRVEEQQKEIEKLKAVIEYLESKVK